VAMSEEDVESAYYSSRFKDCTFSFSRTWDHTLRALPPAGFNPSPHWRELSDETKNIDQLLPPSGAAITPVNFAIHLHRQVRILSLRLPPKRRFTGGWTRSLYIPPNRKVNSYTMADLLVSEVPDGGSLLDFYYLDRKYAISKMPNYCTSSQILLIQRCLWASLPYWKPISSLPKANLAVDSLQSPHDQGWDRNFYVSLFRPQPLGGGVHLWLLSKAPADMDDAANQNQDQQDPPHTEFCGILKDVELDNKVLNKSLPEAAALIDEQDIDTHRYGGARCKGLLTMLKGLALITSSAPRGIGELYAAISPLPLGSFAEDVTQYKDVKQWDRLETGTGVLADSTDFYQDWPHGGSPYIGNGDAWTWRPVATGNTYSLRSLQFLSGLPGAHIGFIASQIPLREHV